LLPRCRHRRQGGVEKQSLRAMGGHGAEAIGNN
jgi:hypothetical protein